jgi:DNA-binding MarR family transcriptional regulator
MILVMARSADPQQHRRGPGADPEATRDFGLLLVQLGFHVAAQFREALEPLGLEPRHVGMLRRLVSVEGQSQLEVGQSLGINANAMVFLVDDLEARGLVERRRNPKDRRSNALYLTAAGHQALRDAVRATSDHGGGLGRSLNAAQRRQLTSLLRRLADEQGIALDALPGPPPRRRVGHDA